MKLTFCFYDQQSLITLFNAQFESLTEVKTVVRHLRELTGLQIDFSQTNEEANSIDEISAVYMHYFRLAVD